MKKEFKAFDKKTASESLKLKETHLPTKERTNEILTNKHDAPDNKFKATMHNRAEEYAKTYQQLSQRVDKSTKEKIEIDFLERDIKNLRKS
ncbi:hypothetical protein [Pseudomonas sp. Irchel s3h17]|uniref:hypothetical protein n=1 Tax=Pseudomonas sp. Irchel s3h17 TaxID=2009182 RepID=UPI000BA30CA6|nr:hypothetical protein [Pseudomonas sp. Irchel s3h17]